MDRRPRRMLSAALAASLGAMLLVSLAPSAGAAASSQEAARSGLVVALAERLIAAPRIPATAPIASISHAKLPPDLIALERKMTSLRINSMRGSVVLALSGVSLRSLLKVTTSSGSRRGRARGHGRVIEGSRGHGRTGMRRGVERSLELLPSSTLDATPLLTADFEASTSPKLAIVRAELLGGIPIQVREIGEQLYVHSPLLAEIDDGRPWLYRSPAESAAEAEGKEGGASGPSLSPSPLSLAGERGSAEAGFGKLAALLADAQSVVEIGRRTIDGQQTIEFEAKIAPRLLRALLHPASKRKRDGVSKGAKVGESKGAKVGGSKGAKVGESKGARDRPKGERGRPTSSGRALRRTKVTLDLYLAPNGLPVRTVLDIHVGEVSITLGLDIFATEVPVSVQPPPASETITEAELKGLQEKESGEGLHPPTKQEEAEQRRFVACVKKRLGKHPGTASKRKQIETLHECERIAKHAGSEQ